LGAARGQRLRKEPCASYPTRQFLSSVPASLYVAGGRTVNRDPPAIFLRTNSEQLVQVVHPNVQSASFLTATPMEARRLLGACNNVDDQLARHLIVSADRLARAATLLLLSVAVLGFVAQASPAGEPGATQLKKDTTQAFDRYVELTEARNAAELRRATGLLWIDALPQDERSAAYAALKRGEVKVQKLETRDNSQAIHCPGGLIHHWTGVVFIPGAKLDDVLAILEDYDRHAEYFAPDVERSKIESRDGDHFKVFLRFRRHKVITVVLNTEHDVRYFRDAPDRAHSRSSAVRIAEVENPGKSDEREKTPGDDDGFLWRMETWWRMEERDGGVYVQSEVASLTRDIPAGLGWLIRPFVTGIPRETLTFTLEATRKAVQHNAKH
jgi:hypothetical protein